MASNIHIISESPDKHQTIIEYGWYGKYSMVYHIGDYWIFRFYPCDGVCYFKNWKSIDEICKILELSNDDYIALPYDVIYSIKLNNIDGIKKLINNHILTYEEKMAFKDFLIDSEFKLKFVD